MDLSLHQLFRIARHWWWLFLLATILAGGTAYWSSSRQQPLYSASATIQVNPPQSSSDAVNQSVLQGSQSLAETYRQLITTRKVLEPLVAQLHLPYDVATLQDKVSASTVGTTRLIHVSVSDPDPAMAAAIANAVAQRFVQYTTDLAGQLSGPYRAALDQQVTTTQQQIDDTQQQIQQLQGSTAAADQQKLSSLQTTLGQLQQQYSNLIVAANQMDLAAAGAQTQVTVADDAVPPSLPYAPRTKLYVLLGAFAGLCLAVGGIALIEYLDNTVKAGEDFTDLVGAPQLSVVEAVPKLREGHDQLFVLTEPQSRASEAIRLLRTNLEFAAGARELATLAITSAGPGEGKSTITANLGVAMAQAGFSTVVVDADLRRPSQHRIFDLRNDRGLTTLLVRQDEEWRWAATAVAGMPLLVLPSGPLPPNPADLLSLGRFKDLLDRMSQEVDIVLVDTPPVLAVSDPLVVSTLVDGVMVVCQAGRTRLDALRRVAQAIPQDAARLVGIVVNRQQGRGSGDYYYYYYADYQSSRQTGRDGGPDAAPDGQEARHPRNDLLRPRKPAPTSRSEG
ncbi:MAG: tyrosine-protein kinase [Thermomicrobiales bacterium]|nr:tyrosine-protein kinase [Thermomicrobiales bacterium]